MNPFAFLSVPGPLVAVLLVLSLCTGSYWAGDRNRNNAWLAKEALVAQQAAAALQAEVARSQQAQMSFTAEYLAMESGYTKLEGKFNELKRFAPLVVQRPRLAGAGHSVLVPGSDPAPGASPGLESNQPSATEPNANPAGPLAPDSGHVGGGLGLSVGAVWLWNSALNARDTPVGACGAANPAHPACAFDAGLGPEAAWDNHAANARTCAQDRLRHQRLIDYLVAGGFAGKPATATPPATAAPTLK